MIVNLFELVTFKDVSLIDGEMPVNTGIVTFDADYSRSRDRKRVCCIRLRRSNAGAIADYIGRRVADAFVCNHR